MSAPALVLLAHGSRDPRSAATIEGLAGRVAGLRPDLRIEHGFLELAEPSHDRVIDRLAAEGHEEIVVVPLLLSQVHHARGDVPSVVARANDRHRGLRVRASDVLGVEAAFLDVLDRRLRTALSRGRVRELDALVLAAAGSSDSSVNQLVARVARTWGTRHRLPALAAFASAAPPSAGEAVRSLRRDGKRHVAVGSFFLAPGFLPGRAAELAREAGAVAVAEPLGVDDEVARAILARYSVGAVELVPIPA